MKFNITKKHFFLIMLVIFFLESLHSNCWENVFQEHRYRNKKVYLGALIFYLLGTVNNDQIIKFYKGSDGKISVLENIPFKGRLIQNLKANWSNYATVLFLGRVLWRS